VAIIFLCLIFKVITKDNNQGDTLVCEVTNLYGGDTFGTNVEGASLVIDDYMSIRINGIDTPELRGECDKDK